MKFFKKHWFKFFLLLLAVACGVVVYFLLNSLWDSMAEYEYHAEVGAVQAYFDRFAAGNYETAADTSEFPFTEQAPREDYIQYLKNIFGSDFSHLRFAGRDGETEGERIYNIYAESTLLGTLRLIPKELEGRAWTPVALVEYAQPVTVIAPSYVTVQVDGLPAAESCLADTPPLEDEDFKPLAEFLGEVPTKKTYIIDGYLFAPEITAVAPDGTVCRKEIAEDGTVVFTVPEWEEDREAIEKLMSDFSLGYARWIARDGKFSAFRDLVDKNSPFYQSLLKFDNQWFTSHSGYEFRNISVSDISRPAEGLMAGTFVFDHVVFYKGEEIIYHTTYRLLYHQTENGWLLAGLTIL